MENSMLIRKIHMNCPLCDRTHEVEERKRTTTEMLMRMKMNLKPEQ